MIKAVGVVGLLGVSSGAIAASAGGVHWNPNDVDDFAMQFNFTQWYTSSADAIGSGVNLAPDFGAAQSVPGGLLVGNSTLTGVGEVYSINGTGPAVFCPGCELTTVFGGVLLAGFDVTDPLAPLPLFDLSSAFINIYVDFIPPGDYPWPSDASNQADVDAAADGELWLSLGFDTFDFQGTVESGFVNSLQTVTGGLAASYFIGGSQPGGFDAQYGASAFFTAARPLYSQSGNGQFKADTVPEPTTLALLGLSLLGFSSRLLRRKAA